MAKLRGHRTFADIFFTACESLKGGPVDAKVNRVLNAAREWLKVYPPRAAVDHELAAAIHDLNEPTGRWVVAKTAYFSSAIPKKLQYRESFWILGSERLIADAVAAALNAQEGGS